MVSDITPSLHHSITPFSDYHSHPQGHRVQPYTQALLQPWIDSARERGLTDIAFTDRWTGATVVRPAAELAWFAELTVANELDVLLHIQFDEGLLRTAGKLIGKIVKENLE